jgi:hypothetical protein
MAGSGIGGTWSESINQKYSTSYNTRTKESAQKTSKTHCLELVKMAQEPTESTPCGQN